MPVYQLPENSFEFPPTAVAEPDGLLALGGDLRPERLLTAYSLGIFPWYSKGEPILWWTPAPRLVLYPNELHISKSMRPLFNRNAFRVTYDLAFQEVIGHCRKAYRAGQNGTWITEEMIQAYCNLHQLGFAHSVEVWQENKLVGGLYGLSIGKVFFGESMFSQVSNASKYGFISLVRSLDSLKFDLVDCQMTTAHLVRMGARELERPDFEGELKTSVVKDTLRGAWSEIPEFLNPVIF